MAGPYNIDETIAEGDPLHPNHHVALAQAVNDLHLRVQDTEDIAGPETVGYVRGVSYESIGEVPNDLPPGTWVAVKVV